MSLLDALPEDGQLLGILNRVIGDEASGTGVAAASKILQGADPSDMTVSLITELDGAISARVSVDASALVGDALDQYRGALQSIPDDPAKLVDPLVSQLNGVKDLGLAQLPDALSEGLSKTLSVEAAVPTEVSGLLANAATGVERVKSEFISGSFGELRRWSESVRNLGDEISSIVDGAGNVEDELIAFFAEKIADLVRTVLSRQRGPAEIVTSRLDAALSATRVAEVNVAKADLIDQLDSVRAQFEGGDFVGTAKLEAAQTAFETLTTELSNVLTQLRDALDYEFSDDESMAHALRQQLDDFAAVEIVDLGNVRDKFAEAIDNVEQAIGTISLEAVNEEIDSTFERIQDAIAQADLGQYTTDLADTQDQLRSATESLDGALFETISVVRDGFRQARDTLSSASSAVGGTDDENRFRFHVQQDIEDLLNGVKTGLQENVGPLLHTFEGSVEQTLLQARDALNAVQGEIATVRSDLVSALEAVNGELESLSVPEELERVRQELDAMFDKLDEADFEAVVAPVIEKINELRDEIKKIDTSSLNEITRGALRAALKVVTDVDFSAQITAALTERIDQILAIPREALDEIEASAEAALDELRRLEPGAILEPLEDVFLPVRERLNRLRLDQLLEPIETWYDRALQELDRVTPAALLQPVVDAHDRLTESVDSLTPDALVGQLRQVLDGLKDGLVEGQDDVAAGLTQFGEAIDTTKERVDGLSPDNLLRPLVEAFDKVAAALDDFDPDALLEPLTGIFDRLAEPLANLTAEHVAAINAAFEPLRALPDAMDPSHNFEVLQQKYADILGLLQPLNVGRIIADLKGPYDSLKVAFEAVGAAGSSLSGSVEVLNPLRDEALGQAAAGFQEVQTRLQNAFPQPSPDGDLVRQYEELRPRIESLVPPWIRDDMTPDSVRQAFQLANPLYVTTEVSGLYDTLKGQFRSLDPRVVQESVRETFEQIERSLSQIDPTAIASGLQAAMDGVIEELDAVDLQTIDDELRGLFDQIKLVVAGLDPRPIVQQLKTLTQEVKEMLEDLDPSDVLTGVNTTFQEAKDAVEALDPAVFKAPLQETFKQIDQLLSQIDVGVLLQPLVKRLEGLRGELEKALRRTEAAFDGMVAAVPV